MNRAALIVTPYFAPQSHAAVFRAYKLAKYVHQFGWSAHVLTVDTNYLYPEDPRLLTDLPIEVTVTRARYVEPSLRGLRMLLGGRDRTFEALRRERAELAHSPAVTPPASPPDDLDRLRDYLLQRWIQTPDAYWTWYAPALAAARRLIRRHQIPLVFTSADPFTSHRIGRTLQREGSAWVADLRDPHAYCHRMHSSYPAVHRRQRQLEQRAVEHANAVTVASASIGMILADQYGPHVSRRVEFIPTGLDEELLSPVTPGERPRPFPYLVYGGEYHLGYGSEFLEAFAEALKNSEVHARGLKLLVVGRLDVNAPRLKPLLRRLDLENAVELVDQLPQRELYRLLQGAEAGVVVSARHYQGWCLYAKLVDYLALRLPVVAVVPDPSESRTHLLRTGLGVFLDGGIENCSQVLTRFLLGRGRRPEAIGAECDRFLARSQVDAFAGVFEAALRRRHARNSEGFEASLTEPVREGLR